MGVPSRTRTHHLHFYIPGWLLFLQGRPLKSSSPATIWNRLLLSGPLYTSIAFCFLHFLISNTLFSVVFYPLPDLAFFRRIFIILLHSFLLLSTSPQKETFYICFLSFSGAINLFHLGYRRPLQTHNDQTLSGDPAHSH